MKALAWGLRAAILLLLLAFAVTNTEPVVVHFVLGQVWQAPLVVVLLSFFAAGGLLGALSLVGVLYRQRREIRRLKGATAKATPLDPAPQ
ncbi:MAG: LapA family protein [Azonexus sp.]|nr:LapA family protein [Betaproteobacteria bacterium]MBK8918466.1 LapA family protein [Betaproteobacteria bacterium]MBP6035436.1 LapA family protein [Azonexus sp.]MBP6906440.1 LapA family protein [Azonexus sp.]